LRRDEVRVVVAFQESPAVYDRVPPAMCPIRLQGEKIKDLSTLTVSFICCNSLNPNKNLSPSQKGKLRHQTFIPPPLAGSLFSHLTSLKSTVQ
jgi:hypothetical protein